MADTRRAVITLAEVDTSLPNRVGVKSSTGTWYRCWDQKLWPRLEKGANLNVELTTNVSNGRTYENITGILGTAPSANGAAPASDRERNIVRESALRAACELFSAKNEMGQGDASIDWILHTADRFAAWVTQTGEEAPF